MMLVMKSIPKNPLFTKHIKRVLTDSLVVLLDGEVAIVMRSVAGTEKGKKA